MAEKSTRTIANNKKARFNYEITDQYEAGLVLVGSEVKSLRDGAVNLKESYCKIAENGELFVYQMSISQYPFSFHSNHDPLRPRKLLLNKKEIRKISDMLNIKGCSLIPLSIYIKGNRIKMKVGVGRGKKLYDKRQTLKERDAKLEVNRMNKQKDYSD
ncbi:SsrA-binding protein SmpB [Desulfoluna butyratoxydans]|uniref:SsrA-binding protein n=1 Tax=Desulfoluna butyratoxydans TaxID=231438 RepID=A0A4V6IKY5_9BACT|nr:SsrA-binding protein SmpB [Desulfoluna butyratoxydans]VFQ42988.1 small protein b [Desulfoluna butyratoxydans]